MNLVPPPYIKHLIAEKRKARAQWQIFKYHIDKARLNYLKNKLSSQVELSKITKTKVIALISKTSQ